MKARGSLVSKLVGLALTLVACGGRSATGAAKTFDVALRAKSDDGASMPGVAFRSRNRVLGVTDATGVANVRVDGAEGQDLRLEVSCPDGFAAPETAALLRLTETRALAAAQPDPIPYEATCTRTVRDVVLVVSAENGPGLPVVVDGKVRATTDSQGNAHVLVRVDRTVPSLSLCLDTTAHGQLKPANPSRTFELTGRDTLALFEQHFRLSAKATIRRSAARAQAHVPEHLK